MTRSANGININTAYSAFAPKISDPAGVVVVSEWALWQSLHMGYWRRLECE